METHKKGLVERLLSATPGLKKEEDSSWKVILKVIPDSQIEENLISILTSKLNASVEDVRKITQSLPIILFSNLTSREAEKLKLLLNETGVRSAISNDPDEMQGLGVVTWPKKITANDLVDFEDNIPVPPAYSTPSAPEKPSSKSPDPVFPSRPVVPLKPRPETPLRSTPQPVFSAPERRHENGTAGTGNEKVLGELEKLRTELKAQLERIEKLILSLKGPVPPVPGLKSDPLLPPRVR